MQNKSGTNDDSPARPACRRVVRSLIEKHNWTLLSEEDLVELVLEFMPVGATPADLERLVIHRHTIVLYESCRQTEDLDRRERGYRELFRFLFRAAHNRWPDLAEIVTQRALVLVYEQIDRCQSPDTFGAFALNKLRQACKDELRARSKELLWEEINFSNEGSWTAYPALERQEALRVLAGAISHLPDKRQQKVVLFKFFGGLSDEAIAARLKITVTNVRVLRHRGLARLRVAKQLRDYFML